MAKYNRILGIICLLSLAGWLGWKEYSAQDIISIVNAVGIPLATYIGIKGVGR